MGPAPPRRSPVDAWCAAALGVPETHLTPPLLTQWQGARLAETVAWARAHSSWYRARLPERFDGVGELPFTTPEDLRREGPRLVCVSQSEVERVVTLQSSGTSGEPKRLYFTRGEQDAIVAFFAAGMATLVEPGDRVVVYLPGPTPGTVGALLEQALAQRAVQVQVHGFVRDVATAAEALRSTRPTSLVALPVHALALARHVETTAPGSRPLRSALLTADFVPRALAQRVERAFGCRVFEHYGMTEMGLGGGVDCEAHRGYHLREADLLVELVDPRTSQPVVGDEPGEVVFTTLTRRALPLIRYRTGDRARWELGLCPCGSPLRRLARVEGRLGAPRVGPLTLPELDEIVFRHPEVVDAAARLDAQGPHVTLQVLGLHEVQAAAAAVEAVRGAVPGVQVDVRSLGGVLGSGPAKRAVERAPTHGT